MMRSVTQVIMNAPTPQISQSEYNSIASEATILDQ